MRTSTFAKQLAILSAIMFFSLMLVVLLPPRTLKPSGTDKYFWFEMFNVTTEEGIYRVFRRDRLLAIGVFSSMFAPVFVLSVSELVSPSKDHKDCPLCNLEGEKMLYEDDSIKVLRTKDLKKHKERIMVVTKEHLSDVLPQLEEHAMEVVEEVGRGVFDYALRFIIMDATYATISGHWHRVCTDLDPKSDDFDQILKTRWIKVVEIEE